MAGLAAYWAVDLAVFVEEFDRLFADVVRAAQDVGLMASGIVGFVTDHTKEDFIYCLCRLLELFLSLSGWLSI